MLTKLGLIGNFMKGYFNFGMLVQYINFRPKCSLKIGVGNILKRFLKIYRFLDGTLKKQIDVKYSVCSKLQTHSICSIRIRS